MFGVVLVGYGSTSFSPQVELSTSHLSKNFLSTSPDCGECGKCSPGLCRAQGLWSDGQLTRGHAGLIRSPLFRCWFKLFLTFWQLFVVVVQLCSAQLCRCWRRKMLCWVPASPPTIGSATSSGSALVGVTQFWLKIRALKKIRSFRVDLHFGLNL